MISLLDDEEFSRRHRGETELQRLDRNLTELVSELRVLQTGVQVLFGFLLTVPFTQRFELISGVEKAVFGFALLSTAVSAALLAAPAASHRLLFRCRDKHYLVATANRLALAGIAGVAISMNSVVFVVTSLMFSAPVAAALTIGIGLVFTHLWCLMPLRRRRTIGVPLRTARLAAGGQAAAEQLLGVPYPPEPVPAQLQPSTPCALLPLAAGVPPGALAGGRRSRIRASSRPATDRRTAARLRQRPGTSH